MKTKIFALIAAGAALSATAVAQQPMRKQLPTIGSVSAGVQHTNFDGGIDIASIVARYNYTFADHFGIEGEVSYGIDGEESLGVEIDQEFGGAVFAVARMPVGKNSSDIFVKIGYAYFEYDINDPTGTITDDDFDGLAYGAGANLMFAPKHGLRVDFTRYEGDDDAEANAYSAAYVYRY